MIGNIISNPFVGCTARDMKFEEVRQYWCSPFELYRLNEGELFTSRTPIVIEGVRGAGKTMILKYLSYSVQKDFIRDLKLEQKLGYFEKRSIGIYFRYKDDFCNMFDSLDCDELDQERIFRYYYELFIIRQMLEMLQDIYYGQSNNLVERVVCGFFDITVQPLKNVYDYINSVIRQMDDVINSSFYDDAWRDKIMPLIGKGNMVAEFTRTISNSLLGWENMLFVVLLDEYENLGRFQSMVNTLIKQVDDTVNLTYRLGMRPAGMDNNNRTKVANEHLQVDRDFILRRLEYEKISDYKQFALDISKKRLENESTFRENGLCDINDILGKKEDIDLEAKLLVKNSKKHFKLIKSSFTKEMMEDVISELSCEEKLMEMYNVLRVMRGEDYKKVGELCRRYQQLRSSGKASKTNDPDMHKYHLDYSSKYRMTLLYMLLTIYGDKKQYYSVNTFLRLSSGSINDFISLCRNVFKHMNEGMLEDLKNGVIISPKIQTYASIDTAEDQRKKVSMSNRFGSEMYTFIDNMGGIFEEYQRDLEAKYPETNQFAFDDENEIRNDNVLNAYLVELINSGAIIRNEKRRLKSVGKARGSIYQLNRIFAPIYQFSYRTRGGFNKIISTADFNEMLKKTINPKKYVGKVIEYEQYDLHDIDGGDEDDWTNL